MRCEYYFWDEPLSFGIPNITIYFLFVGQIASRELAESLNWPMMSTELDWLSFTSTGVFQFSDFSFSLDLQSPISNWLVGWFTAEKVFPLEENSPPIIVILEAWFTGPLDFLGASNCRSMAQLGIEGEEGSFQGLIKSHDRAEQTRKLQKAKDPSSSEQFPKCSIDGKSWDMRVHRPFHWCKPPPPCGCSSHIWYSCHLGQTLSNINNQIAWNIETPKRLW